MDVTVRPPADVIPAASKRRRFAHLVAVACLLASAGIAAAALVVLIRSMFAGYDIADEGFYLYAADPANKAASANGLWGIYLGLVYRAVGYSLIGFRIAGAALLACCAAWLGWQAGPFLGVLAGRPLPRITRSGLVVSTVAAAQLYYARMIFTPSYSWLALCGLALALAGLFGALAAGFAFRPRIGHMVLISAGCLLAFWGRYVAGAGFWLLAQALVVVFARGSRRDRLRLVAAGVAALAVLHVVFLLDAAASVSALTRAARFNFAHGFSDSPPVLLRSAVGQIGTAPRATLQAADLWPLAGLAPALAWFAGPRARARLAATASCAAVLVVGAVLIARHRFDGGHSAYVHATASVLALVMTAALAWAACATVRRYAVPVVLLTTHAARRRAAAPTVPGTAPSAPAAPPSVPGTAPSAPGTAPSAPGTAPSVPAAPPAAPDPGVRRLLHRSGGARARGGIRPRHPTDRPDAIRPRRGRGPRRGRAEHACLRVRPHHRALGLVPAGSADLA